MTDTAGKITTGAQNVEKAIDAVVAIAGLLTPGVAALEQSVLGIVGQGKGIYGSVQTLLQGLRTDLGIELTAAQRQVIDTHLDKFENEDFDTLGKTPGAEPPPTAPSTIVTGVELDSQPSHADLVALGPGYTCWRLSDGKFCVGLTNLQPPLVTSDPGASIVDQS